MICKVQLRLCCDLERRFGDMVKTDGITNTENHHQSSIHHAIPSKMYLVSNSFTFIMKMIPTEALWDLLKKIYLKILQESLSNRVQTMLKNKGGRAKSLIRAVKTLFLSYILYLHLCLRINHCAYFLFSQENRKKYAVA